MWCGRPGAKEHAKKKAEEKGTRKHRKQKAARQANEAHAAGAHEQELANLAKHNKTAHDLLEVIRQQRRDRKGTPCTYIYE